MSPQSKQDAHGVARELIQDAEMTPATDVLPPAGGGSQDLWAWRPLPIPGGSCCARCLDGRAFEVGAHSLRRGGPSAVGLMPGRGGR
jgi:hypothetical protein